MAETGLMIGMDGPMSDMEGTVRALSGLPGQAAASRPVVVVMPAAPAVPGASG